MADWQNLIRAGDLAQDPRLEDGTFDSVIRGRERRAEWDAYVTAWCDRIREAPVWRHNQVPSPSKVHAGTLTLADIVDEMADADTIDELQACIDAVQDWGDHRHRLFFDLYRAPEPAEAGV
jgi:hypothetical protein